VTTTQTNNQHSNKDIFITYAQVSPADTVFASLCFSASQTDKVGWCLTALSAQKGYIVPCEN